MVLKNYDEVFQYIFELATKEDAENVLPTDPAQARAATASPNADAMFDPESKTTQLILWLYSMEPSLSWDVDMIAKEM